MEALQPPVDYLRFVDRAAAQKLANWPVTQGGWWFPSGGWLQPASLCRANLACGGEHVTALFGRTATRFERDDHQWRVLDEAGMLIARAPVLILANATGAPHLLAECDDKGKLRLPLRVARGQVTHLPATALPAPDVVVCRLGYVTPLVDGIRSAGASFIADDEDLQLRAADHHDNLSRLEFSLPGANARLLAQAPDGIESLPGRVGIRSMTQDRLPLIGALPVASGDFSSSGLDEIPRQEGLYAMLGFGARGLVWASQNSSSRRSKANRCRSKLTLPPPSIRHVFCCAGCDVAPRNRRRK